MILRDGVVVGYSVTTSYDDTGLVSGVPHTWTVVSVGLAGGGAPSAPFTITPGRWGSHDQPCRYDGVPCRYPSEGPPPVP